MKPFSHPLRYDTLAELAHPSPRHHYAAPALLGGVACVTNGYVALKAYRGLWAADDFPEPPAGFWQSFEAIPFDRFPSKGEWHPIAAHLSALYRRGEIKPFGRDHRAAPSPAVCVGRVNVLLSMVQLAARLPKCEISVADTGAPALYFRCSGAMGLVAAVRGDLAPAFHLDPVMRGHDGRPKPKSTMGSLPLPGWPPPPPEDS